MAVFGFRGLFVAGVFFTILSSAISDENKINLMQRISEDVALFLYLLLFRAKLLYRAENCMRVFFVFVMDFVRGSITCASIKS